MRVMMIGLMAMGLGLGCKSQETSKPATGAATPPEAKPETKPEPKPEWTAKSAADASAAYGEAFTSADEAGIRKHLSEDIVFRGVDALLFGAEPQKGIDKDIEEAKVFTKIIVDREHPTQLVLATPNKVATVLLLKGTVAADFPIEALRGKKFSRFAAQILRFDDKGKIVSGDAIADEATLAHQLGVRPDKGAPDSAELWGDPIVALATGSETEKANLETMKKVNAALAKNDAEAIKPLTAVPLVVHDTADPKPMTIADHAAIDELFAKNGETAEILSRDVVDTFAAGDWVFERVRAKIKLKKDLPELEGSKGKTLERTTFLFTRLEGGKVAEVRSFVNDLQIAKQLGDLDVDALRAKIMPAPPDAK